MKGKLIASECVNGGKSARFRLLIQAPEGRGVDLLTVAFRGFFPPAVRF